MMSSRINKLNDGFTGATSNNLPSVDFEMFMDFVEKSIDSHLETQGWKMSRSCRESYGDNAIGYVQVKRLKKVVEVIAKITPEHKVRETAYSVSAQVDEETGVLDYVKCDDCIANQGVCKHAVAFAMWLHRRTETPSPTSTHCYWKRSILSTVKDQGTFLKVSDMNQRKHLTEVADDLSENVLQLFLKEKPDDCQLYLHFSDVDTKVGSIHSLIFQFYRTSHPKNAVTFLEYAQTALDDDEFKIIEQKSKAQSKSPYWYEMRYGRITASKIYEVSRCQTPNGSLVNQILGSSKFRGNWATKRGLELENKVKNQLEAEKHQKFTSSGFLINKKYTFFGASPDFLSDTHAVEIKCPVKSSTVSKYISSNGTVNARYVAQLQTQMFLSKRKKGFFCVADPDFESNSKITVHEMTFQLKYCEKILSTARDFWMSNVYPKLKRN